MRLAPLTAVLARRSQTISDKDASLTEMDNETVGEKSVSWGRSVITAAPKTGGAPVTTSGRYTVIAKRIDGKWVYMVDHASNDPAPVAAK
jgi:ketosteroid isomerase-like protein